MKFSRSALASRPRRRALSRLRRPAYSAVLSICGCPTNHYLISNVNLVERKPHAKLAEGAGIPCTIGSNLEREVATAAMAQVAVCSNIQCERYPGDLIGPLYYEEPLSQELLRYEADLLWVPEKPGLGVRVK